MRRALIQPRNLTMRGLHSTAAVTSASATASDFPDDLLVRAKSLLSGCRNVLAITGAGISTESGIPDYRSPGRPPHRPTSHQQFMSSHATRQRYWARSLQGFETLAQSKPNAGHVALAYATRRGPIQAIITQNVDNLHELAGSPPSSVVHLHGTINHIRCMSCDHVSSRAEYQLMLRELNPTFVKKHRSSSTPHHVTPAASAAQPSSSVASSHHTYLISPSLVSPVVLPSSSSGSSSPLVASLRPDGDVELGALDFTTFQLPSCPVCTDGAGNPRKADAAPAAASSSTDNDDRSSEAATNSHGILKPDLVFFGASVPKSVHARADALLAQADGILVVGTSLTVWSAFRLLRQTLDRVAPGQTLSVVQLAEENARLNRQASNDQSDRAAASGSNVIVNGSTTISPVAAHTVFASTPVVRVPSVLPIVILNQGPTRLDPLAAVASNVVKIDHTRASHALNAIFDVPLQVQAEAAAMQRHTTDQQAQQLQDGQLLREEYEQIAQRNLDAARKRTENIE